MARAAAASCSALMYLLLHPNQGRSKVLVALLPPTERSGILHPHGPRSPAWRRAVSTFLDRQRQSIRGGPGFGPKMSRAVVYVESSPGMRHTGFAAEWRPEERQQAGPLVRTTEHGEVTARPKHRLGAKKRYHAFRRTPGGTRTSAVVRRERYAVAAEMGQQAISGLSLRGNERKRKRRRLQPPHRGRLPPWAGGSPRSQKLRVRAPGKRGGRGATAAAADPKPSRPSEEEEEKEKSDGNGVRARSRREARKRAEKECAKRKKEEEREIRKRIKESAFCGPLDNFHPQSPSEGGR